MFKSTIQQLDEKRFGSMVSAPAIPFPEVLIPEDARIPVHVEPQTPTPPATTLSGLVLSRLTGLHPQADEVKKRRSNLISEAAELLAECDALVTDCQNEHRGMLEHPVTAKSLMRKLP